MKNLVKIAGLTLLFWFSSCSMYRGVGTFEPCLPKDKITIKERAVNFIAEPDGTYRINSQTNPVEENSELIFKYEIKRF